MSLEVTRPITRRQFVVDYVSPLICDEFASGSAEPDVSILPFDELLYPSGLLAQGFGTVLISWNAVENGLCYNLYRALAPGGPYQLINSCDEDLSYSDAPGPGFFYYRVSAITPDGEGPLSPPVQNETAPIPPGPCPAEEGTETPSDLMIPEDTLLGTLVPNPFIPTHTDWFGDFNQEAMYKISYVEGAWKDETNPFPNQFKVVAIDWIYSDTIDTDPLNALGGSYGAATQAEVETKWRNDALEELEFFQSSGQIGVKYTRVGTPSTPVAGSPNPTFTLHRTGTWGPQPAQVRIKDFNEASFNQTCPGVIFPSADPVWDGQFGSNVIALPSFTGWKSANELTVSINGALLATARVEHTSSHPTTSTGGGWLVRIQIFEDGSPSNLWLGYKGVGTTPVGRYYRDSGCSTGPDCLEIEEY